jgi:hypothetical protein
MSMKRVMGVILVLALAVGSFLYYKRYTEQRNIADGDVESKDLMTPEQKTAFDRRGATDEAESTVPPRPTAQPAPEAQPKNQSLAQPTIAPVQALPANLPQGDSITPNPPNGMAFGGRGTYQWYRQGNLTWRVNTENGSSCIAYATMEEWRKSIVLQHGCGGNA